MANTEKQVQLNSIDSNGKTHFHVVGRAALSTGGGSEAVTVTGARVGDIVMISLEDDDGGTSITTATGKITAANTLTIVRTDDGSSTDTAYASYSVFRP